MLLTPSPRCDPSCPDRKSSQQWPFPFTHFCTTIARKAPRRDFIMSTAPQPPRPLTRPTFPPLQSSPSANSSTYQSYSSTTSLDSQSSASAPLPSPSSSTHHQGFFGSLNQQHQTQQSPHQNQAVQPPQQYSYQPNREGAGRTAAETNRYLDHSALLAEAAKRAQMAVVMRDIEGMEL